MFLVCICCFLCYLPKLQRGMALAFSADLHRKSIFFHKNVPY